MPFDMVELGAVLWLIAFPAMAHLLNCYHDRNAHNPQYPPVMKTRVSGISPELRESLRILKPEISCKPQKPKINPVTIKRAPIHKPDFKNWQTIPKNHVQRGINGAPVQLSREGKIMARIRQYSSLKACRGLNAAIL